MQWMRRHYAHPHLRRSSQTAAGPRSWSKNMDTPVTLLYRTPNIRIDEFEFHATVESDRSGQARRHFRWRRPGRMWAPLAEFQGHPPKRKAMAKAFEPFKKHMVWAERGSPLQSGAATGTAT